MVRILEVNVDDKGYGGVYAFVTNIIRNIDKNKFSIAVCAFEKFDKKSHIEDICASKAEFVDCSSNGMILLKQLIVCKKYFNHLVKSRYDGVHIHSDVAYKLLLYALVSKLAGVKRVMIHSHSSGVEGRYKNIKRLLHLLAKEVLKCINVERLTCSEVAARWMYDDGCLKNVKLIHNGIDVNKFTFEEKIYREEREKLGVGENEILIGTVARMSYQKYPEKVLEIFKELLTKNEKYRLLWVGTGPLEEKIKNDAKRNGVYERIIFLGNTDEVDKMYQAMDVFILTSRFEGLCIAAIEAQAAGLPCVCSDTLDKATRIISVYNSVSLDDKYGWINAIEKAIIIKKTANESSKMIEYDIKNTIKEIEHIYDARNDYKCIKN